MRFWKLIPLPILVILAGCGSAASSNSTPTPSSLALNHVHSIVIAPHNANALYMGTHYHLYKSVNGGKTWQSLTHLMMLSMAMDPAHQSTLYAVSNSRGFLKTTDAGKRWEAPGPGLPTGSITGVAVNPVTGTVLAYGVGMYRSTDRAAHWTRVLKGQSLRSVTVSTDGMGYAGSDAGIYVSHDDGRTWTLARNGANQPIINIVAAQHVAYAAGGVTVLRTSNDGRTWQALFKAPIGVEFLGVSPTNPNEVFGEVGSQGLYASYDGGKTWQAANNGIPDRDFNASTIKVASASPNVVYTGSWGLHVYVSHTGGHHWTRVATLLR